MNTQDLISKLIHKTILTPKIDIRMVTLKGEEFEAVNVNLIGDTIFVAVEPVEPKVI